MARWGGFVSGVGGYSCMTESYSVMPIGRSRQAIVNIFSRLGEVGGDIELVLPELDGTFERIFFEWRGSNYYFGVMNLGGGVEEVFVYYKNIQS